MKVFLADKMSDTAITELKALGAQVEYQPDASAESLPGVIGDAEVLVVRSTKVQAPVFAAASNLKLVIRAGAGVNTIDLAAATAKNVLVGNTPGKNTDAVAELALGLMVAADRQITFANADLAAGKWRKNKYQKARGLKGRTLGLIGFGAIGRAVAKRALAFEMKVITYDPYAAKETAAQMGVTYLASLDELMQKSDVISLHVAATPETKKMVNKELLGKVKKGAILINASRGEIVDTAALKEAIKTKGLRAALDVFEDEPAGGEDDFADTELAGLAVCTPHIGASTDQAAEAVAEETVRMIKIFQETGDCPNIVNKK
jgi:D-3-phosphoglycerate dehydrogenase